MDGSATFSPIVALTVGFATAPAQLQVFPNPAPDAQAVAVRVANTFGSGVVQTYSQLGQLVSQLPITEATERLVLPALVPGLYHVVLRNAAGQPLATQRLVVSR